MSQPGYRSKWAKYVGGATRPLEVPAVQAGYRSLLWFQGGGAGRPPSRGDYAGPRSLLAFWMGGANFHFIPGWKEERFLVAAGEGIGALGRELRGRYPIDDEEVIEFLELWTAWQDIE